MRSLIISLLLVLVVIPVISQKKFNEPVAFNYPVTFNRVERMGAGGSFAGINIFTSSKTTDTVLVTGTDSTDIVIPQAFNTATVDSSTSLRAKCKVDTIFVYRHDTTAHALNFTWLRFRLK